MSILTTAIFFELGWLNYQLGAIDDVDLSMVDKASLKSGRDAENIFLDPDKEFVKTSLGCEILFFFPGRASYFLGEIPFRRPSKTVFYDFGRSFCLHFFGTP